MKIKRIIAGFLLSSQFLSAGTYAFSDSGNAISNWYHHSFLESSSKIEKSTTDEISDSFQKISIDIQTAANHAADQLMDFQSKLITDSERSIKEHSDHYIQQLQATKEFLQQQNEKDMQLYKEQVKEREAAQITQDAQDILFNLVNEQK